MSAWGSTRPVALENCSACAANCMPSTTLSPSVQRLHSSKQSRPWPCTAASRGQGGRRLCNCGHYKPFSVRSRTWSSPGPDPVHPQSQPVTCSSSSCRSDSRRAHANLLHTSALSPVATHLHAWPGSAQRCSRDCRICTAPLLSRGLQSHPGRCILQAHQYHHTGKPAGPPQHHTVGWTANSASNKPY